MFRLTVQYGTPADPAAFDEHYFARHVPLCAAIPGLHTTTISKPRVVGPGTAPYLVAELDFEDAASFNHAVVRDGSGRRRRGDPPAARLMFAGELTATADPVSPPGRSSADARAGFEP